MIFPEFENRYGVASPYAACVAGVSVGLVNANMVM